jgi:hypothetical protein
MRNPKELTYDQLVQLVENIIEVLYRELDDDENIVLNPDKEWDADICLNIVELLEDYNLIPTEIIPCPRHDLEPARKKSVRCDCCRMGHCEYYIAHPDGGLCGYKGE